MAHLPVSQEAVVFDTTTNTLSYTKSSPVPSPSTGHVIRVHATAITNKELTWGPFVSWSTLHVPCFDVSGIVLTPVPNSPFQPGDKVYARINANRDGAARAYATLLPSEAAKVPEGLDMVEASTVPMSAHTAWQALFEHGNLSSAPYVNDEDSVVVGGQAKGKRILVLGVAGGVGQMAVQFGKIAGAWVAGTASAKNEKYLKEIGIDEVVDYTKTSVSAWINGSEDRKFDLVLDFVGGKSMLDGWSAVKHNGTYVSIVPGFEEPEGGKPDGVTSTFFIMEERGSELQLISKFIEKGLVRGSVDSVWKLQDYEDAFKKTASGHARGKVVFRVAANED